MWNFCTNCNVVLSSRPPGGFLQRRCGTNASEQTERMSAASEDFPRDTLITGHAQIKCSLNICVMAGSQTQAAVAGHVCAGVSVCVCVCVGVSVSDCVIVGLLILWRRFSCWLSTSTHSFTNDCVCCCVIQPHPQFLTLDSFWLLPVSVSLTLGVKTRRWWWTIMMTNFTLAQSCCQVCHFLLIRQNITYEKWVFTALWACHAPRLTKLAAAFLFPLLNYQEKCFKYHHYVEFMAGVTNRVSHRVAPPLRHVACRPALKIAQHVELHLKLLFVSLIIIENSFTGTGTIA